MTASPRHAAPLAATPLAADPVLAAFAAEVGNDGPVAVHGGHTRWSLGGELADGTRLLRAPIGVVQYAPEEMTVTVRAGTPVAELGAVLAQHGQRCALPERSPHSTVGGAIAVGENHLCVLGRGTVRAGVLEVRYVSAEGRLIRAGGPTVKNVTGFDLPRLLCGSLGTLGLFAEFVLRTNPIPPATTWMVGEYEPGSGVPFALRDELLSSVAVLIDGQQVWVCVEGHPADVRDQVGRMPAHFREADGPPPLPAHRWSLTPGDVHQLGRPQSAHHTGAFVAAVGVGTVWAQHPQPPRPSAPGSTALAELAARIKHNFDPTGRLNPGRVVGSRVMGGA